jgi:uncharacterized membrane protein
VTPSRVAHSVTLVSLAALLVSLAIWWFPSVPSGAALLAALAAPLLLPLPGLFRGNPYTHAWTSLLALFYVLLSMTEVLSNPRERVPAGAALFASLLLFAGCVLYVRFRARERR